MIENDALSDCETRHGDSGKTPDSRRQRQLELIQKFPLQHDAEIMMLLISGASSYQRSLQAGKESHREVAPLEHRRARKLASVAKAAIILSKTG